MKQEITVAESDSDIRLDRWFKRHRPDISHALLQKLLRKGAIRLDGKKAETSTRVQAGQVISLPQNVEHKPAPTRREIVQNKAAERKTLEMVLWRNEEAIILNKPAGLAVQGGSGVRDSVDARLDALAGEGERPKLVHRLDKDTSGVLVLGRTSASAAKLAKAFAGKSAEKYYWALVVGIPEPREGEIDAPLLKVSRGGEEMMEVHEEGKRAITHYRVIEKIGKGLAWVELMPVSGRTHQLRVHMATFGHPICGDGKYGGNAAFPTELPELSRLHLHARRIVIPPMGIDMSAPLPPHMRESWEALGLEL